LNGVLMISTARASEHFAHIAGIYSDTLYQSEAAGPPASSSAPPPPNLKHDHH
jgi:hypothetical protein